MSDSPLYAQVGPRLGIRMPRWNDEAAFIAINQASTELHRGWVAPPVTHEQYAGFMERAARPNSACFVFCLLENDSPIGMVNLSEIVRGALQSAYMGYYIGAPYAGQGYMREAIGLVLNHAFGPLGLHRVEANIQPGNARSIAVVRRLGFTREGFSRRYLQIDGDWRDHERWAILAEDWQAT